MAALSTTAEMARKQAVSNEAKAFEARARLENKVRALEADPNPIPSPNPYLSP